MRKRLIIISDLWGKEKSGWLTHYTDILAQEFDIVFYDSCELGEVDKSDYNQDSLHQQFVDGGIDLAVETLMELETNPVDVLAFSIGGTIAWKFGLKTGLINSLTCASSTRLRKETHRPNGDIQLYYGEDDEFKPNEDWIESMILKSIILPNAGHEVYREADFAKELSEKILELSRY